MSYLLALLVYAGALVGLGLFLSRKTSAKDFFVAGRQLPSGLIFATFLAANVGAGSTVGATGRGSANPASIRCMAIVRHRAAPGSKATTSG